MRQPPPVSVRCTGGWLWQRLQWALPALAVGVGLHGVLRHLEMAPGLTAAFSLAAVALLAAGLRRAARRVAVDLAWDGTRWTADGQPVQAQLRMDLGGWLLLQLRPTTDAGMVPGAAPLGTSPPPGWLAVAAGECGPAWHALRVAVLAGRASSADGPRAHV